MAPLVGVALLGVSMLLTPLAVAVAEDGRVGMDAAGDGVIGLEPQHHSAPVLVEQRYALARVVDRLLDPARRNKEGDVEAVA